MRKHIICIVLLSLALLAVMGCSSRRYTTNLRVYAADKGSQETFYDAVNGKIIHENVWVFQSDGSYAANLSVDGLAVTWAGQYDAHTQGQDFVIAVDTNGDGKYEETLYVNNDVSVEWRRPSGTLTYYLSFPSTSSE